MTLRATQISTDYRRLYQRTMLAALVTAVLSLAVAIIPLAFFGHGIAARVFLSLLSLVGLALASFAGLVALGGIIALRRDALERAAQPYFSGGAWHCCELCRVATCRLYRYSRPQCATRRAVRRIGSCSAGKLARRPRICACDPG